MKGSSGMNARNVNSTMRPSFFQTGTAGSSFSKNTSQQFTPQNPNSSTIGLMRPPKPTTSSTAQASATQEADKKKIKQFGESDREKLVILTGNVERVLKYGKIFTKHFCYIQVIGGVVSVADGAIPFEKKMLLRDKKGPILHLVYYAQSTYIKIEDFHLGQNLRAVGRMISHNTMRAISIRSATFEEVNEALPRMCQISDFAVYSLCGDKVEL